MNAAFALRCPSSVGDFEVAGTILLVEHAEGADLFGFHFEGGPIAVQHWDEPYLPRALTIADDDRPVVVHGLADGSLSIDPGSPTNHDYRLRMNHPIDVSHDEGTDGSSGILSDLGHAALARLPGEVHRLFPDICEFEQVTPETAWGAVLASDVVVHEGEPCLPTIVADVTDRCAGFSSGAKQPPKTWRLWRSALPPVAVI